MWPFTRKSQANCQEQYIYESGWKPKEEYVPEWVWKPCDWQSVVYCHCGQKMSDDPHYIPKGKVCPGCGCIDFYTTKTSRVELEIDKNRISQPVRASRTVFWEGCTQEAQQKDSIDKE